MELSNPDTNGTEEEVFIFFISREPFLGKEKVSLFVGCLHSGVSLERGSIVLL